MIFLYSLKTAEPKTPRFYCVYNLNFIPCLSNLNLPSGLKLFRDFYKVYSRESSSVISPPHPWYWFSPCVRTTAGGVSKAAGAAVKLPCNSVTTKRQKKADNSPWSFFLLSPVQTGVDIQNCISTLTEKKKNKKKSDLNEVSLPGLGQPSIRLCPDSQATKKTISTWSGNHFFTH